MKIYGSFSVGWSILTFLPPTKDANKKVEKLFLFLLISEKYVLPTKILFFVAPKFPT
jgi:hypothetical protein